MSDFKKDIETHIEFLVDDEMRSHAFASTEHDTAFQIFRLLGGYRLALTEIARLKATTWTEKDAGDAFDAGGAYGINPDGNPGWSVWLASRRDEKGAKG